MTWTTKHIHKNRTAQPSMERYQLRSRQLGLLTNLPLDKLRVAWPIEIAHNIMIPKTTMLWWHKTHKKRINCRLKIQSAIIEALWMEKSNIRFQLHRPKKLRHLRCQCHLRPKLLLLVTTNYQYRVRLDLMAVVAKKLQRLLLTNKSLVAPTRSASLQTGESSCMVLRSRHPQARRTFPSKLLATVSRK